MIGAIINHCLSLISRTIGCQIDTWAENFFIPQRLPKRSKKNRKSIFVIFDIRVNFVGNLLPRIRIRLQVDLSARPWQIIVENAEDASFAGINVRASSVPVGMVLTAASPFIAVAIAISETQSARTSSKRA